MAPDRHPRENGQCEPLVHNRRSVGHRPEPEPLNRPVDYGHGGEDILDVEAGLALALGDIVVAQPVDTHDHVGKVDETVERHGDESWVARN